MQFVVYWTDMNGSLLTTDMTVDGMFKLFKKTPFEYIQYFRAIYLYARY